MAHLRRELIAHREKDSAQAYPLPNLQFQVPVLKMAGFLDPIRQTNGGQVSNIQDHCDRLSGITVFSYELSAMSYELRTHTVGVSSSNECFLQRTTDN